MKKVDNPFPKWFINRFLLMFYLHSHGEMLREIFLINRSVLQYHYSRNLSSSDDDKAVLSSGFLSAIQDFSTHARSDVLESFSTGNEYFLYLQYPESNRLLVGIFDRKAPENLAREAMNKIMNILLNVKMPVIEGMQLSSEEKEKIKENIERVNTQLFSNEKLSSYVLESLEGRSDIPLAFLVDSYDNSIITSFSRPKPLFKDAQVREFLLVHTTLQKVFESFGFDQDYSYFFIESDDYSVVACNGGRVLSVVCGAMGIPKENVYEAATTICYADSFEAKIAFASEESAIGKIIFSTDGRITEKEGGAISQKSIIFISSIIKNIESMFKSLTRRPFKRFFAKAKGKGNSGISLINTSGMTLFELHELVSP
ncbi:MAG: hypothetical protein ACFFDQ_08005 [Candidatus Thorarchaeota archaeon]